MAVLGLPSQPLPSAGREREGGREGEWGDGGGGGAEREHDEEV